MSDRGPNFGIGFKVVQKKDEVFGAYGPVWSRMAGAGAQLAVLVAILKGKRPCRLDVGRMAVCISVCCWAAACSQQKKECHEAWEMVAFPGANVIAVAPALNYSGSSAFDPVVVGDLMASELSTLPGVGVIGVNRVMAVLAEQNVARIQSPQHALDVCNRLGADAILVFAVTEFDPYTPVVGITAQLYTRHPREETLGLPPGGEPGMPATAPASGLPIRPVAECQRVFNATHERVQNAVRDYADKRKEGESPYGWRKFVASQESYLRFCCFSVARDLLMRPVAGFGVVRVTED